MTGLVAPVSFGFSLKRDECSCSEPAYGEARAMRAIAATL